MAERIQVVGTEEKLSQSPAHSSPSSDPRSGQFQMVGTNVPMGHKGITSPSANPRGGMTQVVGTEAMLSRSPVKGWGNAASLTMSDQAHAQSRTAAGEGGRKSHGRGRKS